jgi:hypothetical protein
MAFLIIKNTYPETNDKTAEGISSDQKRDLWI